ncbi:hypothetical protein EQO05_12180 [Methanosarcina sp. MSH10X1]|uniref:helix-turn-helix transcriptional regulator n=1 Tax=Methanosarcina sp. MSH10X1 TaxID=2507075 RepID=UPI000FFC8F40|nr:hypothetical protein [Methanosarcina sp. MSH10X1]RXA17402.1 hypothetical protein EQO05_12180 [Methanosarcina sp. MSH10X1]
MNLRLFIICITAVLALVGPALANSTATVHGAVYGWDTFEPLENAVVEVNSTPSQSMVAKYGLYSFDLVPGDYTIKASYYQSSTLIYSAEETLKIQDEGKYVLDLLLLPVYSKELMDGSEVNGFSETPNESEENSSANNVNPVTDADTGQMTSSETDNSSNKDSADHNWAGSLNLNYLSAALLLFLLLAASYRLARKDKKIEENQPQRKEHITEKGHTAGEPSEPFKVSGLSAKAPDRKVELSHKNVEKSLEVPDNLESEPDEGSQIKESRVKPSIASATEPITVSVKEPVIESLKEPVIEPVGEPVKVPLKEPASETTEKLLQGEPAEIKTDIQANGMELAGSELQEVSSEKVADNPSESPETEIPASRKKLPLPTDLQEVMDIIRGQGGRITQKDLRSRLKYSEGKVSLMLADLERRELIEKFKRGRGNVVILKDEER